jgi:hypothetical protein
MASRLCPSLCHGGRGNNKLCNTTDDLDETPSSNKSEMEMMMVMPVVNIRVSRRLQLKKYDFYDQIFKTESDLATNYPTLISLLTSDV